MADLETEREMVRKAIELSATLSNCLEWVNEDVVMRVRRDRELSRIGITPEGIQQSTHEWVIGQGNPLYGKVEDRPVWRDRHENWFWIVITTFDELPNGLFVEMELAIPDDEYPVANLVNAHHASFQQN